MKVKHALMRQNKSRLIGLGTRLLTGLAVQRVDWNCYTDSKDQIVLESSSLVSARWVSCQAGGDLYGQRRNTGPNEKR